MRDWWRRVRRLWALVTVVPWTCAYCQHQQDTPDLLWNALRTQLLCARCGARQNYPDHIRALDPRPIRNR